MEIESFSELETIEVGKMFGVEAKKGDIFCLVGDISAGKTHFTKGFAKGLLIEDNISSPTFTIVNKYDSGRLDFNHFDVYRLEDKDELINIGYEDYFYSDGVTLIEWADMIKDFIPEEAIWIKIEKNLEKGNDYRIITVEV